MHGNDDSCTGFLIAQHSFLCCSLYELGLTVKWYNLLNWCELCSGP